MTRKLMLALTVIILSASALSAEASLRDRIRTRMEQRTAGQAQQNVNTGTLAGLSVAWWLPDKTAYPAPLVIFSHGLYGCKTQSTFLMEALADNGYIVIAPDLLSGHGPRVEASASLPGRRMR